MQNLSASWHRFFCIFHDFGSPCWHHFRPFFSKYGATGIYPLASGALCDEFSLPGSVLAPKSHQNEPKIGEKPAVASFLMASAVLERGHTHLVVAKPLVSEVSFFDGRRNTFECTHSELLRLPTENEGQKSSGLVVTKMEPKSQK